MHCLLWVAKIEPRSPDIPIAEANNGNTRDKNRVGDLVFKPCINKVHFAISKCGTYAIPGS
jgi:hypothetical protein